MVVSEARLCAVPEPRVGVTPAACANVAFEARLLAAASEARP